MKSKNDPLNDLLRRALYIGFFHDELSKYVRGVWRHNENLFRMAEQLLAKERGWA